MMNGAGNGFRYDRNGAFMNSGKIIPERKTAAMATFAYFLPAFSLRYCPGVMPSISRNAS